MFKNTLNRIARRVFGADCKVLFFMPINKFIIFWGYLRTPLITSRKLSMRAYNALPVPIKENYVLQKIKGRIHFSTTSNTARRYLKPGISIQGLFEVLFQKKVRYVVLRWFETLPEVQPGEDVDLLIHDDDLSLINELFYTKPSLFKFDIYTISAHCGFAGMPYYPPTIAREILDRRVLYKEKYWVPCTSDYFNSLAYHALYHKAEKSGLPCALHPTLSCNDHNYKTYLKDLADKLGLYEINIDMDSLHTFLSSSGWTPNIDTLRRLAHHTGSKWITSLLPEISNGIEDSGEMICFVVRKWAMDNSKKLELIRSFLLDKFDILHEDEIKHDSRQRALDNIRGGEWGKGPYPVSGGDPAYAFIAFDYHPVLVNEEKKKKYPYIQNEHVFIKHKIRNFFNGRMLASRWTNCIHSSDDEIEALDYIKTICPDKVNEIKERLVKIRTSYKTSHRVIRKMRSNNTRSKTELIEYKGGLAIKKTFKLGRERFCERERYVYSNFADKLVSLPALLENGENYIIIPYFEDILHKKQERERVDLIKEHQDEILHAMYFFFSAGYALVNFYPGNILITQNKELILIDFEFLFPYGVVPKTFFESYDIKGLPLDFKGDMPKGMIPPGITYKNTWEPIFGKKALNRYK